MIEAKKIVVCVRTSRKSNRSNKQKTNKNVIEKKASQEMNN